MSNRIYVDTEFYEDGKTIDLISIGMVRDNGEAFYVESCDFRWGRVPDHHWIQANVRPHLNHPNGGVIGQGTYLYRHQIRDLVRKFAGTNPEFWGYYADYDWVALCQLFGTMVELPVGWPMLCLDIKQEVVRLGNPTLPTQTNTAHNALHDALWNRQAHHWLLDLEAGGRY